MRQLACCIGLLLISGCNLDGQLSRGPNLSDGSVLPGDLWMPAADQQALPPPGPGNPDAAPSPAPGNPDAQPQPPPVAPDSYVPPADSGPPPPPPPPPPVDTGVPPPSGIWQPQPGTTWQWQLTGTLNTSYNVQMYDIDLFDNSASDISGLKAQGRKVICYFSAGSYEDWRPDAGDFPSGALGSKMSGWDELWLDIRSQGVRSVMTARLDLAKSKGCDGVEPDNVDGYSNNTGFPLTSADQIDYNTFLATEAHNRGLSIGLKNDLEQVSQLVSHFDWALNEECLSYSECDMLMPFINANKAVFHVEYTPKSTSSVCPARPQQFDTLIKNMSLDAWFEAC